MKKNKLPYRDSGFKVPSGYFESFEDRLMRTVSGKPVDDKPLESKHGFAVPNGYFESLDDKILQKLEQGEQDKKVRPLYKSKKIYYITTIAAVFLAIITTVLFNPSLPDYSIENVEIAALEAYIDEGYIDLNFNEISAYITDEGHYNEEFSTIDLNDEDLLNYLNENLEDPNVLYE